MASLSLLRVTVIDLFHGVDQDMGIAGSDGLIGFEALCDDSFVRYTASINLKKEKKDRLYKNILNSSNIP